MNDFVSQIMKQRANCAHWQKLMKLCRTNLIKHPQHTAQYRPAKDGYCALSAANVLSSLVSGESRSTMVIQKVRFEPP